MTPIKTIVYFRACVWAMDTTGALELLALAPDAEHADWVAWSLAQAHQVPVEALAAMPVAPRLPVH